ncbi:LysM peptidoglycan-binding domain-containing protein [Paraburkholderia sp. MM5482-R1]|uniref:LysM peptidoglycan-binding domain-containing protein n=1 Tax=unclassified Paraburkholderia TaxID=2615204 RepID=UPI003D24790E
MQRRDELVGVTVADDGTIRGATGDRKHNYYYLNGNRVGNQGNDGVETVDYVQELAGRLAKGSESQYKVFTPVGSADFDENFMAINGVYPGVSPGTWTVRDGDTLQSVASSLWGDATLWYILADANGLKGDDVLKAGQMLTVPNQVTNVHNTATTFKPYDPGKAIGNTQPTLPDPPPPPAKDGGCGPVAAIIAVVVAAVATVFTAGAASMALAGTLSSLTVSGAMTADAAALVGGGAAIGFGTAVAASVIGGAVGAAAAQGVMIAAGEQSGFNWKGVAMGAVGAAVGSSVLGVTGVGTAVGSAFGGSTASQFAGAAAQGAIRSITTQGIGVLTGAQHSFDWKGVAASAIASGVAYGVGAAVRSVGADFGFDMQSDSGRFVTGVSAGVAAGAASTIVRGGSLGRNVGAISMDAVASTIGNLVVDQVQAGSVGKTDTTAQRVQEAIGGMNAQVLPGGLGGVGSGFVAPEASYSNSTALFGVYGGLVDSSQTPYAGAAALFGPSSGLATSQIDPRPAVLADNSGGSDNLLYAWIVRNSTGLMAGMRPSSSRTTWSARPAWTQHGRTGMRGITARL